MRSTQQVINQSHAFGLKIWKPALYRKSRQIDAASYASFHAVPGSVRSISMPFTIANIIWSLTLGWVVALMYLLLICLLLPFYAVGYTANKIVPGRHNSKLWPYILLCFDLAGYIVFPFGKFIAKKNNVESEPLLSSTHSENNTDFNSGSIADNCRLLSRRIYASGLSGTIFFIGALLVVAPMHLLVSSICFYLVFPIPMAKLNYYLLLHLLNHPLQLSVHPALYYQHGVEPTDENVAPDWFFSGQEGSAELNEVQKEFQSDAHLRPKSIFFWTEPDIHPASTSNQSSASEIPVLPHLDNDYSVVLCTYRSAGLEFTKYTVDGINIIFINLSSMILWTILNFYFVGPAYGYTGISNKNAIFLSSILSTVPLAFFIGTAVSSITAETGSVAIGSVINATFGSIIEIILYVIGLLQGKEMLVQGSLIGSFLLGLLALPGVSMFFGGLKRKEQTFNTKSAGVTSTMLLVSVFGVFTPTMFQSIYGLVQLRCVKCEPGELALRETCGNCQITTPHPTTDPIYLTSTRPLMYFCAVALVLTYIIGLIFTFKTHAHRIYPKKQKHVCLPSESDSAPEALSPKLRPRCNYSNQRSGGNVYGTVAIPNTRKGKAPMSRLSHVEGPASVNSATSDEEDEPEGHPSIGWSIIKSASVLCVCTILYAIIAEIMIDCLDEVLETFPISERIIGLTLFAIVPSITEFYNAIAFAQMGNIELSLEIGSAYAIQVALLQIPTLVGFSAIWATFMDGGHTFVPFTLIFPRLDFYSVIMSVLLLTYVYQEGKSNYFKGSMLLVSYFIVIATFISSP